MWNFLLAFIPRAIVQGIPLLYGSTGEIITEKSGNSESGYSGCYVCRCVSAVLLVLSSMRDQQEAQRAMNPVAGSC